MANVVFQQLCFDNRYLFMDLDAGAGCNRFKCRG